MNTMNLMKYDNNEKISIDYSLLTIHYSRLTIHD